MALYTVTTGTTDLTAKGKRIASIHINAVTAAGAVSINDGTGGTTVYKFPSLAANANTTVVFSMPALPRLVNGPSVVVTGADTFCTLDIV